MNSWEKEFMKESQGKGILPCPFCKSTRVIEEPLNWMILRKRPHQCQVRCLDCRAHGPIMKGYQRDAIWAWNSAYRRIEDESL